MPMPMPNSSPVVAHSWATNLLYIENLEKLRFEIVWLWP